MDSRVRWAHQQVQPLCPTCGEHLPQPTMRPQLYPVETQCGCGQLCMAAFAVSQQPATTTRDFGEQ
jgi:hypothetical protein